MKKIVCLLFISMSIFLFGCNSEKLQEGIQENNVNVHNVEETKTEKTPIRKTDTDSEKQKVLDFLYEKTIDEIEKYYKWDVHFEKFSTPKYIIPNDLIQEEQSTGFFQEYFSDNIEMQDKLSQLPTDVKYMIYLKLKFEDDQETLDSLYVLSVDELAWGYTPSMLKLLNPIPFPYPDVIKDEQSTKFFQGYFSDDIGMQDKLSQLSIDTKYFIYKKLAK